MGAPNADQCKGETEYNRDQEEYLYDPPEGAIDKRTSSIWIVRASRVLLAVAWRDLRSSCKMTSQKYCQHADRGRNKLLATTDTNVFPLLRCYDGSCRSLRRRNVKVWETYVPNKRLVWKLPQPVRMSAAGSQCALPVHVLVEALKVLCAVCRSNNTNLSDPVNDGWS